jgi:hypothetical protein
MKRFLSRTLAFPAVIAAMIVLGACNKKDDIQTSQGPPGGGGPGMGGGMPGMRGGPRSPVGEIMMKIGGRNPQALAPAIGEALKAETPEWDKLVSQTKELLEMTQSMAKYDPPNGSKESWAKYTSEFSSSASALEKAATAKDKDGALSAHKSVTNSCNACHQEHRAGPGGFGPMGGKGGFGPPGKGGFGPPGKDGGFGPPPGKDGGFGPPPGKGPPGKGDGPPPGKDE